MPLLSIIAASLISLASAQTTEPRVLGTVALECEACRTTIRDLVFSPDGSFVAIDGFKRLYLDGRSDTVAIPYRQLIKGMFPEPVGAIAVSRIGDWAAGMKVFRSGLFGSKFTYAIAVFRSRKEPAWISLSETDKQDFDPIAFSRDGRLLAGAMRTWDNHIWIWDVEKGELLRKLDLGIKDFEHPTAIAFSDAHLVVAVGDGIQVYDTGSWDRKAFSPPVSVGGVRALAISPDGTLLASSQWNGPIHLFTFPGGESRGTFEGHSGWVPSLAFSPDGKLLASASHDKTVRLWNVASLKERAVLGSHVDQVQAVAFSPDGTLLASAGDDRRVLLHALKDIPEGTYVAPKPKLPAALTLAVSFKDPSGDGYLDAGETGTLKVETANAGPGEAHGVDLAMELSGVGGISLERRLVLGSLAPGTTSVKEVSVAASQGAETGKASISVQAREGNGFDSPATKVEFSVRAFRAPKLELAGVSLSGGDVVKANQVTKVLVKVRNAGSGPAAGARITLSLGQDVFAAGEREAALGDLAAGAETKAAFEFFVNSRFKGKTLPVSVDLAEATGKFGLAGQSLGLAIGEAPSGSTLLVKTREDAVAAPTFAADNVDSPPAAATPSAPDAFAVVMGIERYREESVPAVEFAARDARTFSSYLTRSMGFDSRNVITLVNGQADRTDIDKYLGKWLKNRVGAKSRVIVYFAGHGAPNPETGEGYILPYSGDPAYTEETALPLRRLYESLAALPTKDVTVILDACFSGRGDRSVLAKGARPFVTAKSATSGSNTVVLSATGASQISTHFPDAEHGMMTYFLLKALRGDADANKDGRVTTKEIFDFIQPAVEREARKLNVEQTPTLSGALGDRADQTWVQLR